MAVDIWLPRLKIANVGRASPEKIIKHFLEQAPWEIPNSKSWKNHENVNKTLHLPHLRGDRFVCEVISITILTWIRQFSLESTLAGAWAICLDTARTSRLSSNTPSARYCLCCRRLKFLWYNLRHGILWENRQRYAFFTALIIPRGKTCILTRARPPNCEQEGIGVC